MTNNQLTRERIELIANFHRAMTLPPSHAEIEELARIALAAMDSEPVADVVAWSHPTEERTCDIRWRRHDVEPGPLYRHAQPAPVVTFYRDGIEAAANYLDQLREAYDSEHGRHDPETGSFEFGNDAHREYSSTLEELAEGIRGLHPNAGNSPVIPDGYVMVPKIPGQAHLNSIAMRYRHDFYLLNDAQKDNALAVARQMYEECSGQGFYTLPAAPQEVK